MLRLPWSRSKTPRLVSLLCARQRPGGEVCGDRLLEMDHRCAFLSGRSVVVVVVVCGRCRTEWWLTSRDLVDAVRSAAAAGASAILLKAGRDHPILESAATAPT